MCIHETPSLSLHSNISRGGMHDKDLRAHVITGVYFHQKSVIYFRQGSMISKWCYAWKYCFKSRLDPVYLSLKLITYHRKFKDLQRKGPLHFADHIITSSFHLFYSLFHCERKERRKCNILSFNVFKTLRSRKNLVCSNLSNKRPVLLGAHQCSLTYLVRLQAASVAYDSHSSWSFFFEAFRFNQNRRKMRCFNNVQSFFSIKTTIDIKSPPVWIQKQRRSFVSLRSYLDFLPGYLVCQVTK